MSSRRGRSRKSRNSYDSRYSSRYEDYANIGSRDSEDGDAKSSRGGGSQSSRGGGSQSSRSRDGGQNIRGGRPKSRSYRKKRRRRIRRLIHTYSPLIGLCAAVAVVIVLFVTLIWPSISQKPRMALIGNSTVTTAQGEPYVDEGIRATFHRKDVSGDVYVTDDVDTSTLGTYKYMYNADGRWRTFHVTRRVKVRDLTGPEITLNGDDFVIVDDFVDYVEPGAVAVDNCDGDVTEDLVVEMDQENDYTWFVTYTVKDKSGNEGVAVREIQERDDVAPEITLNGEEQITIDEYTEFVDPGVTAVDNRDGNISAEVDREGYVDIYRPDTYTITYTVADSSGNEATAVRSVEVVSVPAPEDHTIYLTFDDGPSEAITPQILDILAENGIKATFFIVDYSEEEIPILQRAIDEGHTIGIHGYSHAYDEIYSSPEACMENITKLADKLRDDFGYDAFVTRFPGGTGNTDSANYCEGVMTAVVQLVTDEGWMYMDWNCSGEDSVDESISADQIFENVVDTLQGGRRNVCLLHDYGTRQSTADALQSIIDYGIENGYTFLPVTRETIPVHQPVEN